VTSHKDLGLVDALAQLSFLVHNALAEIAGQHDLSIIQTRLLGVLRDREPTMNELGRHLGLDKSSISGLVDRAQRRGLVTRTVSAIDRRAFQVSITDAGRQLVEQVAASFAERIGMFVAGLPETKQQLLSQLATQIVAADADRHGIDLRTSAG
jgi:DNA-binding MarR family transcriptional regulator